MATLAEEYSEAAGSLSAILTPLVNERVDSRMDAYVTKDYLDAKLEAFATKLENKMLLYLGSLVAASMVMTLAGVKLMLPEASSQPSVIVLQSPAAVPQAASTPVTQPPVINVPAQ